MNNKRLLIESVQGLDNETLCKVFKIATDYNPEMYVVTSKNILINLEKLDNSTVLKALTYIKTVADNKAHIKTIALERKKEMEQYSSNNPRDINNRELLGQIDTFLSSGLPKYTSISEEKASKEKVYKEPKLSPHMIKMMKTMNRHKTSERKSMMRNKRMGITSTKRNFYSGEEYADGMEEFVADAEGDLDAEGYDAEGDLDAGGCDAEGDLDEEDEGEAEYIEAEEDVEADEGSEDEGSDVEGDPEDAEYAVGDEGDAEGDAEGCEDFMGDDILRSLVLTDKVYDVADEQPLGPVEVKETPIKDTGRMVRILITRMLAKNKQI